MTKDEFLNTPYNIGEDTYTIGEMMAELKRASTATEAHFWHGQLALAIGPFDKMLYDIRKEMNCILEEKGPLASSVAAIKGQLGIDSSQLSPNIIFVGTMGDYTISMPKLWQWVCDVLVSRMRYSYGWLALLLFATHHHLLIKDDTKNFSDQMLSWFPNVPHRCTQDQVNLYRRGFFKNTEKFDYSVWIKWKTPIPKDYEYVKGQHLEGYKHIQALCIALEAAEYSQQIFINNTNK